MTEDGPALPRIPTGKIRFRAGPPVFVRVPALDDGWLLLGAAERLPIGEVAIVPRWNTKDFVFVRVRHYVAERVVKHRPDSRYGHGETRYVLATFEPYRIG
jgi:hypothetical protein